ncbi:MAG: hypothetical protein Q9184_006757 [Pyrenodesmia sp. 2 TL-2023]
MAISDSKRASEATPRQSAKRKQLLIATSAAIDKNSRQFDNVHDNLSQDAHKAALTEQQAWQQDPTSPEINNVVPPSSEKAKIDFNKLTKRFFHSHGFWPWQTVDESYTPRQWSRGLLQAFLTIPNDVPLSRLRHLLKTTVDERADRSVDEPRVGVSKGRKLTAPDITKLHRSGLWTSFAMHPDDQSPPPAAASAMLSPPRSQDTEGSVELPASASSPPPSQVPTTLPPIASGEGTDERSAKHARVNTWNQASYGPASRTKRRRIADQGLTQDEPDFREPDVQKVKRQNQALSPDRRKARAHPFEDSIDEGGFSLKPVIKHWEVPREDDSALKKDQVEGTTLAEIRTPQSMVEKDGSRPFAAYMADPFARFSTFAASSGTEMKAKRETELGMSEMSGISRKGRLEEVEGNADDVNAGDDDDDDAVIEGLIRGEGLENAAVDLDGHATNNPATASTTVQPDDPPESTVKRAIFSLQPRQRLTTTCIELLMKTFNLGDLRIFDPAYIDCKNPQPKPALGIPPNKTLLIPLYHQDGHGHWTLAAVVNNTTAYFYNSWTSRKYEQQAYKALDVFCRSQSSVPESQPKLQLRPCKCPQQDNADDCGIFVLVAALNIMAQQPIPDSIDSQSWRLIFQAALDVSKPLSSIEASLRVEQLKGEGIPTYEIVIQGSANPRPNRKGDTSNLPQLQALFLRQRVGHVQKTFKTVESQLANARKTCMTLEILESTRNDVHDSLLAEETKWVAECARLEGVRHAVSTLEYCKTNVRESLDLDQTIADAHRFRVAASGEVGRSTLYRFAIGRATKCAKSISLQYLNHLEAVCEERKAILAHVLAIDREERQAREERLRWIEELEKECAVLEG